MDVEQALPTAGSGRRRRGFLNHLILFFGAMVVLVPLNFFLMPAHPWFAWVMVAWGAPLAVHAAYAMGLIGRPHETGKAEERN